MSNKPVILTDIDGVCVRWSSGLPFFMAKHNMSTTTSLEMITDETFRNPADIFGCDTGLANILIEEYNNSSFIRYLSAYDDALVVINELKAEYDFVAVTALGTTPIASLNRIANLNTLFPGAFKEVMVCNHGESKTHRYLEAKAKYGSRLKLFIDDLAVNLDDCNNVISHLPLLHMLRGEREPSKSNATVVKTWHDVKVFLQPPHSHVGSYDDKPITKTLAYGGLKLEAL